jgi:quercetin dioxygenase-like cupin family protein
MLNPGDAAPLTSLVGMTPEGIASRVLTRAEGGQVTLFAFDGGESLTEHVSRSEGLAIVLDGHMRVTVDGRAADAPAGTAVSLPASVPHAVEALAPSHLLLVLLATGR